MLNKYLFLLLLLFSVCQSNDCTNDHLPECILNMINDPNPLVTIKTIRIQNLDKVIHYWINTDATHYDGTEQIIDKDCNQVCYFCGECSPPKCLNLYSDEWKIIWRR